MAGFLSRLRVGAIFALMALIAVAGPARAEAQGIARIERSYVDAKRAIKASSGFAGSPVRRIDTLVWFPQGGNKGPWPLVIYSHGTLGAPDNAMHIVRALVSRGYVVAAPNYPLSSRTAFTAIRGPDISDVAQQVRDVSFVIDSLLADPEIGPMIDPRRIGTTGHSLGGVTSYFASFGRQTRDPRISATALIGGGDPVQAALSSDMGLAGTAHSPVAVPVLFLSAEKDVFARMMGRPGAAYARVAAPRYEVLIRRGVHVWFHDGDERPADNRNPDCLFFDANMPGVPIPGCEERIPLIGAARQQAITRDALTAFFDGYLKQDRSALKRLRALGRAYPEAALTFEE